MIAFIVRRTFLAAFTIFSISIFSFVIIQLPAGDFADNYVNKLVDIASGGASSFHGEGVRELKQAIRERMGLDRPMYFQYYRWARRIVTGDLGISLEYGRPVWEIVRARLLMTVVLAVATVLFTWLLAIPIGIYTAVRQRSAADYTMTFVGFMGLATPDFLLALVLLYVAFAHFGTNLSGLFSHEYVVAPWSVGRAIDLLKHLWIPALVLGTSGTAGLIRVMRANLLDELHKPYVVTARAKGLAEWRLILKYPVRVALNPLVSTIGYLLPYLISGSIIVSVVLSLPTLGPIMLQALLSQDMFMASSIVLVLGVMTVIGTLISDILLVIINPRIRIS